MRQIYKFYCMSLLGGSSSRSLLGGSFGGAPIINQLKTTILFKRDNTEIQKNLTIEQGKLTLNNQKENSFLLRNEDTVRSSIISTDRGTELTYHVPEFSIKAANKDALTFDASGRAAFNKKVDNTEYHVDISGDLNFSGNLYQDGSNALFDLQNLFNYLTKPPPAFEDNSGNSRYDRAALEIYWRKGKAYDVSYHLSTTGEQLPHITSIHIDLSGDDWIPIAELSGNATNHTIHLGDSYNIDGVDLSFNDEGLYHFRVYGVNRSQDPSINTLDYLDISFQNVETFPENVPTLGFQRAFDVSNEKYININGIPNILSVDVLNGQFTISDVSDGFLLRNREKTECAEFIGDTKYDISNQLFKISHLEGNELTFDICGIQFRNSLFIQGDLSLGSLDAFNIRGVSSSIVDVSRARWWLDVSSLVFGDELSFPELSQSIFDISLEEIDHDGGGKTYKVSRNPFDHSRNIVDDISSSSLFFAEGRFVSVYYHSSLIGGETYYRDWSDVSGPDYSGLSGEGIQDVIRENGEKKGELYKWIGKRFDISISTIDQTYRVLNINGETTSQKWRDMGLRVYILQHLYDNVEGTGEPFSMTTWMDATRSLSSRVSSSPFIESHRDGYGCYLGDGRISLKLNTKKGMNHVFILIGLSNNAGNGDSHQTYIDQILLE